jgi:alkanesulfonate monooxygenase SsuD/methylene tetrahydromethanopterin reductase-like flavin-dependent oxidoreductase (luciferase family)
MQQEADSLDGGPGRPRLRVGLNLPAVEGSMAGGTARWIDLLALAQQAEQVGFDSVWMPDHLQVTWADHTRDAWECWTFLAALAARTSRIELGSLVTPTVWRNPALLAKMAHAVDEISAGRLVVGLGAGWAAPEYGAFGYPADRLVDRFEEALRIIVPLLRTGHADFEGRYYMARGAELRLRGPRPDGPPILIGAKGPRMLRLAAQHADAWNAQGPFREPEAVRDLQGAADAACVEVRRDPRSLRRSASVVLDFEGRSDRATIAGSSLRGSAEIATVLRGFARAGLDEVQLWLTPTTGEKVEECGRAIDVLARS